MRWWMTNGMMLGLACAFLVHFSLIVMWKRVVIQEPNLIILSLEIAGMIAIIVLAILNFIKLARS